jgi:polyhydroxyalkanoate synthesis regulator phasin
MFGLTTKLNSLESKIDCGFQQLESRLDSLENRVERNFDRVACKLDDSTRDLVEKLDETTKHLVGKLDNLSNGFEENLTNKLESLREAWNSGFARTSQQSALNERIARLELDIEQLKAHTRS